SNSYSVKKDKYLEVRLGGHSLIKKHTCKNGLRIVMEQIPSVRSVTIGIWVLAGSRNENETNNGISHFLEHMIFKGTKTKKDKKTEVALKYVNDLIASDVMSMLIRLKNIHATLQKC